MMASTAQAAFVTCELKKKKLGNNNLIRSFIIRVMVDILV